MDGVFVWAALATAGVSGALLGRLSQAGNISSLTRRYEDLRKAYEALRADYEKLHVEHTRWTDRDGKGRFVRKEE